MKTIQKRKENIMKRIGVSILVAAMVLLGAMTAVPAGAVTFAEDPGTAANGQILASGGSGTFTSPYFVVEELYGGNYAIKVTGMPAQPDSVGSGHTHSFWFQKLVFNKTGNAWTSFDNELWSQYGIPSTDGDGLSFVQGYEPRPFQSTELPLWTEVFDVRDYVNFYGGSVADQNTLFMQMAISDQQNRDLFWLNQQPNLPPPGVPEPLTMLLLGFGLVGIAGLKRKFQQ